MRKWQEKFKHMIPNGKKYVLASPKKGLKFGSTFGHTNNRDLWGGKDEIPGGLWMSSRACLLAAMTKWRRWRLERAMPANMLSDWMASMSCENEKVEGGSGRGWCWNNELGGRGGV